MPDASFTVAVAVVPCPAVSVADPSATVMLAGTGAVGGAGGGGAAAFTVMVAVPETLPLIAVIVAVPAPFAVTTPVFETTSATFGALDDHTTDAFDTLTPSEFVTVAVSVVPCPTVNVDVGGLTETLLTGAAFTVTATALDVLPPLDAVMLAVPARRPVTTPVVASTEATRGLSDDQVTGLFVTTRLD